MQYFAPNIIIHVREREKRDEKQQRREKHTERQRGKKQNQKG